MCEHEQRASECEQVNPRQFFQEHPNDVDKILFDTWDGMFDDVEEYSCEGAHPLFIKCGR